LEVCGDGFDLGFRHIDGTKVHWQSSIERLNGRDREGTVTTTQKEQRQVSGVSDS
jgi:hypothetical protein